MFAFFRPHSPNNPAQAIPNVFKEIMNMIFPIVKRLFTLSFSDGTNTQVKHPQCQELVEVDYQGFEGHETTDGVGHYFRTHDPPPLADGVMSGEALRATNISLYPSLSVPVCQTYDLHPAAVGCSRPR